MSDNKVNFTAGRVAAFCCEEGKQAEFLWDTSASGLGLKASAGGSKRYVLQSRLESGATIRLTIGDPRTWTLSAARDEARRLQTLIDQGIDPRQEKLDRIAAAEAKRAEDEVKRVEAQRIEAPALEAWQSYIDAKRPRAGVGGKRWGERTLLDHQRLVDPGGKPKTRGRRPGEGDTTMPGALLALLNRPLERITADCVRAWLKDEAAKRPTQAALAFRLLRAFLNWCSDRPEYRDQAHVDACGSRMAKNELPKKIAKDDCLQREQLSAWFAAVRQIQNPVIAAYLQTTLLAGARREEVAGIRWEDVDFQWKSLTIGDKVDGKRTIPLTPFVASLLAALPRRNEWVFSSPTAASGRLQEPRIQHNKALTAAGLPDLSIHGLRRSFATLSEWVECPAGISAQIMGHKPTAIAEKHYLKRPLDLLRKWHTTIEAWILTEAGIEQPGESDVGLRVVRNRL
ncbi:MAG: site-specific tyrosine recombinase XerC [Candidatus Accumulibacter appositus]|uniref:Site-specific tyrosine recombinase XerC n=1 Tax=Candidatus Accumulibacter appositus TaxID=1454003 RepID=A0A011PNF5_9PROT|nr:MAG: site-specific tyrosine recombinase XerC [Candidatus Accumulibacter appositus]